MEMPKVHPHMAFDHIYLYVYIFIHVISSTKFTAIYGTNRKIVAELN